MPIPWLRLIDGVLGATDIVRWAKGRSQGSASAAPTSARALDMHLAGVVVEALKEAFNRDSDRLEIERQRVETERRRVDEERARAERALRLELLRQAGDREIARLRLLTGVALVSLLGSMWPATHLAGSAPVVRVMLGLGWLLLVGAVAGALSGQSRIARSLARDIAGADAARTNDGTTPGQMASSPGGLAAPWLIVAGLAAMALSLLLA